MDRRSLTLSVCILSFYLFFVGGIAAWAGEAPPQPNFLMRILGGTVHYNTLGITAVYYMEVPREYNPEKRQYIWQPGMEIPEGAVVIAYLIVDNKREKHDNIPTIVEVNNLTPRGEDHECGWNVVGEFKSGTGVIRIPTRGRPGPLAVRVYAKGGRDMDNCHATLFVVVPREEILARMGLGEQSPEATVTPGPIPTATATPSPMPMPSASPAPTPSPSATPTPAPAPVQTGRVRVVVRNGEAVQAIGLIVDGTVVTPHYNVRGETVFENVPAGTVRIQVSTEHRWFLLPGMPIYQTLRANSTITYILERKE